MQDIFFFKHVQLKISKFILYAYTVSLSPFWRENKGIPPEEVKHITCADILTRV